MGGNVKDGDRIGLDRLIDWLFKQVCFSSNGLLVLIDWLVDWLVDWLIGSIGWWIGLIDQIDYKRKGKVFNRHLQTKLHAFVYWPTHPYTHLLVFNLHNNGDDDDDDPQPDTYTCLLCGFDDDDGGDDEQFKMRFQPILIVFLIWIIHTCDVDNKQVQ